MSKTLHRNELVRITDLATVDEIIDGHDFESCQIVGPAILAPVENVAFDHPTFNGSVESVLYEIDEGWHQGLVGLRNVTFKRCRFERVGIAGNEQFCLEFKFGTTSTD